MIITRDLEACLSGLRSAEYRTRYHGIERPSECAAVAVRSPCLDAVDTVVAGVPLCRTHLREIILAVAEHATVVEPNHGPADQAICTSVVYYMGNPDTDLVKIGTSSNLKRRFAALAVDRPRLLVLATEPGTHIVEARRHSQFDGIRSPIGSEREWFRKVPMLMEHITAVRQDHGIIAPGGRIPDSAIAPLRQRGLAIR